MRSLLCLAVTTLVAAVDSNTCYKIDGSVSTVSFRCNNETSGHTTCCQPEAVCYSNGICRTTNNDRTDYQRVGCTDQTWEDPACLNRCEQYAPGSSAGIRPCDGIDEGTHYCCVAPGNGIASDACCRNSSNIFVLSNSIPTVVAQMPLSQTTGATGTPTAAPAGGSESDATTSSSGGTSGTTTIGLSVGLGVGIPLAVAVAGVIWFLSKKCRRIQGAAGATGPAYDEGHKPGGSGYPATGYSLVSQDQQLSHPGASPKHAVHEGMVPQEIPANSSLPTEMASTPSERP